MLIILQELYEQMLNVCIASAKGSISLVKTGAHREQRVADWNDFVDEYYIEALYLHYWWKVGGRPHQGHIFYLKKTSPISVDGLTDDDEICSLFSDKYNKLYNSSI